MLTITGQLQLPQLSPRYLSRSCLDSPGTCGRQTANLVSSKHMGQKWPYLYSSKQYILTVIRAHLYTYDFLMRKRHLILLIIGRQQRNCYTERCHCILWNCLSFGIKSKSLRYEGVTHYEWHFVVQMGSGKGDRYHRCCVMCMQMT